MKAKEQKDNQKASLLIKDLQNQLEKKENEKASLMEANEEMAASLSKESASMIQKLQNQLEQKEDELASIIKAKEEISQKENELAHRIQSQPQVDGESLQFQGNSGEWVSFPASVTAISAFGTYISYISPNL